MCILRNRSSICIYKPYDVRKIALKQMLRITDCLDIRPIDGGKVVSSTHRPDFTLQKHYYFSASGILFC
jgi:hypothetical protein